MSTVRSHLGLSSVIFSFEISDAGSRCVVCLPPLLLLLLRRRRLYPPASAARINRRAYSRLGLVSCRAAKRGERSGQGREGEGRVRPDAALSIVCRIYFARRDDDDDDAMECTVQTGGLRPSRRFASPVPIDFSAVIWTL